MDIQLAIEKLLQDAHEVYETATDSDISATESATGRRLPPSYKEFVKKFSNGAYIYFLQEVCAVGAGNEQISSIQSNYPIDQEMAPIPFRDDGQVSPRDLVPFGLDSNGNAWCFVVDSGSAGEECPVAYLDTAGRKLYGKLGGFLEWLEILIKEQTEVIRTLYDDDVIYDELNLG